MYESGRGGGSIIYELKILVATLVRTMMPVRGKGFEGRPNLE
jgi:hypothetical protein